jgi:toxin HigB-1
VIRSFRGKDAEALFDGESPRRFQRIARVAQRKLMQLHAAQQLRDLTIFPSNRLEALKGDRKGQHSIRINDQYAFVSFGVMATRSKLRLLIIIRRLDA